MRWSWTLTGPLGVEAPGIRHQNRRGTGPAPFPEPQVMGTGPWSRSRGPGLGRRPLTDSVTFQLLSRRGKCFPSPEAILVFISHLSPTPHHYQFRSSKGGQGRGPHLGISLANPFPPPPPPPTGTTQSSVWSGPAPPCSPPTPGPLPPHITLGPHRAAQDLPSVGFGVVPPCELEAGVLSLLAFWPGWESRVTPRASRALCRGGEESSGRGAGPSHQHPLHGARQRTAPRWGRRAQAAAQARLGASPRLGTTSGPPRINVAPGVRCAPTSGVFRQSIRSPTFPHTPVRGPGRLGPATEMGLLRREAVPPPVPRITSAGCRVRRTGGEIPFPNEEGLRYGVRDHGREKGKEGALQPRDVTRGAS